MQLQTHQVRRSGARAAVTLGTERPAASGTRGGEGTRERRPERLPRRGSAPWRPRRAVLAAPRTLRGGTPSRPGWLLFCGSPVHRS